MAVATPPLALAYGLSFGDLYSRPGLEKLDAAFAAALSAADPALRERFDAARADPAKLATKEEADFLIAVAPHLDRFIASSSASRKSGRTWSRATIAWHRSSA